MMDFLTPAIIIKILGFLFATIGVLIGVIWALLIGKVNKIEKKIDDMTTSFSKVPRDYMSKDDCKRLHDDRNNK